MTSPFKNSGRTPDKPILWGAPGSAYSGKARSYLIKKGIAFDEFFPSHPRFGQDIMPPIGYFVLPVVDGLDGSLRERFDGLMKRTGGAALMSARPARRLVSEHYRFRLA